VSLVERLAKSYVAFCGRYLSFFTDCLCHISLYWRPLAISSCFIFMHYFCIIIITVKTM